MYELALTYDDIMMVPTHSEVSSRREPNTSTKIGLYGFDVPIVSAPMNTVTESEMAMAMGSLGAGSVIHRYMSIEDQCRQFLDSLLPNDGYAFEPFVAIGASGDFFERAQSLYNVGVTRFCVDVANGHSQICVDAVKKLRWKLDPNQETLDIMAGNVCTEDGASKLACAGANIIRVGIGPGAMCTTRLVTGFGVPQVTAIQACSEIKKWDTGWETAIVADGGIRSSGDIVKALAFGADAVMIGGLLAGTDESPGKTERDSEGRLYKHYHGMASVEGRKEWFDQEAVSYVPEGSSTKVWHKGEAKKIVEQLNNSLKVGMSFANAMNLEELRKNAKFVRITDNGRREGNPNRRMFSGREI